MVTMDLALLGESPVADDFIRTGCLGGGFVAQARDGAGAVLHLDDRTGEVLAAFGFIAMGD
jgi:hypothetical protein